MLYETRLDKIELAIAALFRIKNIDPRIFNRDDFLESKEAKEKYYKELERIRNIIFK
jgi:hypothetical protein